MLSCSFMARSRAVALAAAACLLAGGAQAAGPAADAETRGAKDPNRVADPVNQFAFQKPEGWHALTPRADGVEGITVLINYAPLDQPHAAPPADSVKVELRVARLGDVSFSAWSRERRAAMAEPGFEPEPALVSAPQPFRLAGRDGLVYTRSGAGHVTSLQIELEWGAGRALAASILPADSPVLAEALAALDTLRDLTLRETGATPALSREIGFQLAQPLQGMIRAAVASAPVSDATTATCNGPAGTFDMGEAPTVPFTITMPFPSGSSWEVGGIGSYFGNGCHINLNNDYYATDWNRRNTNCGSGYLEDDGFEVRPVATGVVKRSDCTDTTGYGCQVIVEHTNASGTFRTRYAHLQSTSLVPNILNTTVNTGTLIGRVGCSGLASCGPHLHLSLTQSVSGTFYSRCNGPAAQANCPNGLPKSSPQTPKPSPMQTTAGSTNISDGQCYTSNTGGSTGWTQTIDDSSASCTLNGPSQYWFSVSGYGINNQMRYTWNSQTTQSNWAQWNFSVPSAGSYKFEVYIPSNHATTTSARYQIWNGSSWLGPYVVNQNNYFNAWVTLATLSLPAGTGQVKLSDVTGETTGSKKVGVDAVRATRQ